MHLIGEANAFLAGHQAVGFIARVILLYNLAEGPCWEHSLPVVFGEDSVFANVLVGMLGNAVTLLTQDHVHLPDTLGWGALPVIGRAKIILWQVLDHVFSPDVVGHLDFSSFVLILNLIHEHLEETFFGVTLDLGDHDSAIHLKVVAGFLSSALTQGHACLTLAQVLLGPNDTLNGVAFVAGREVSEFCSVVQLVDWHGGLVFG